MKSLRLKLVRATSSPLHASEGGAKYQGHSWPHSLRECQLHVVGVDKYEELRQVSYGCYVQNYIDNSFEWAVALS